MVRLPPDTIDWGGVSLYIILALIVVAGGLWSLKRSGGKLSRFWLTAFIVVSAFCSQKFFIDRTDYRLILDKAAGEAKVQQWKNQRQTVDQTLKLGEIRYAVVETARGTRLALVMADGHEIYPFGDVYTTGLKKEQAVHEINRFLGKTQPVMQQD